MWYLDFKKKIKHVLQGSLALHVMPQENGGTDLVASFLVDSLKHITIAVNVKDHIRSHIMFKVFSNGSG